MAEMTLFGQIKMADYVLIHGTVFVRPPKEVHICDCDLVLG